MKVVSKDNGVLLDTVAADISMIVAPHESFLGGTSTSLHYNNGIFLIIKFRYFDTTDYLFDCNHPSDTAGP